VKIWSPHTGQLVRNLTGHSKGLSDIAWSSDSVFLASASDDTTVRIWTVDTVRLIFSSRIFDRLFDRLKQGLTTKILKGHTSYVFCLNYNSASDKLVSGCCDGDIKIWDVTKGEFCSLCGWRSTHTFQCLAKCLKTLHAHLDYVTAVHFNRDASLIVSCACDGLM